MDKQVKKYNTQIRELLDIIAAELPNNKLISTIHRRFRVALSVDRTYIIEETAPELLLYRDFISESRWDDLIYKNWESEIGEQKNQMIYEVDNNSLRDMVGLLRSIWQRYDSKQQANVHKAMKRLLSYCIKYYNAKLEGRP
jgi:hypothetical protein